MISLDTYFQDSKTGEDRRIKYGNEYTNEIKQNAEELLKRVEALFMDLGVVAVRLSSGWRPQAINAQVGGAKKSLHTQGKAIDLVDSTGELKGMILKKPELLKKHDLWMEDWSSTPTWCHLDIGSRTDRPIRTFKP